MMWKKQNQEDKPNHTGQQEKKRRCVQKKHLINIPTNIQYHNPPDRC